MDEWDRRFTGAKRRCDCCKQIKDVAWVPNPYQENEYNEAIEEWICKECYEELLNI